jgi:hypothetical protein
VETGRRPDSMKEGAPLFHGIRVTALRPDKHRVALVYTSREGEQASHEAARAFVHVEQVPRYTVVWILIHTW